MRHIPEGAEFLQNLAGEVKGAGAFGAGAKKNSQKLGIAQNPRAFLEQLLARPVVLRPAFYARCLAFFSHHYFYLSRFKITFISMSFSAGLLAAIINVTATSALSSMRLLPSRRNKMPFRCKKYTNKAAAIRLLPSTKLLFLVTKYKRCADFSSTVK